LPFADRAEAGRRLAEMLQHLKLARPVILALPRGGVPVAAEIAAALAAPLDVLIVRKIGTPANHELAMGAIVDGDPPVTVRNEDIIVHQGVSEASFAAAREREHAEARRRRELYVGARPHPPLTGRDVVIVDDGVATGATMRAAVQAVRAAQPTRLVVAVPVGAADALSELRREADSVVCLETSVLFGAISLYYADFRQVSDETVVALLAASDRRRD
jgi:predicted phosphoribosyltransferase